MESRQHCSRRRTCGLPARNAVWANHTLIGSISSRTILAKGASSWCTHQTGTVAKPMPEATNSVMLVLPEVLTVMRGSEPGRRYGKPRAQCNACRGRAHHHHLGKRRLTTNQPQSLWSELDQACSNASRSVASVHIASKPSSCRILAFSQAPSRDGRKRGASLPSIAMVAT